MGDALEDLYGYAQRSYIRMEAEQLIHECLELGQAEPLMRLVESLIVHGPSALALLREVLEEIRAQKLLLGRESWDIRNDLLQALSDFGVYMPRLLSAEAEEVIRELCDHDLERRVREQASDLSPEEGLLLEEICHDAGEQVRTIARQMALLTSLEQTVRDWLAGLAYEAAHDSDFPGGPSPAFPVH
jgi:hypothetical protein